MEFGYRPSLQGLVGFLLIRKALDDSITESILQIGTFKAPPKDLLENDHFIF